MDCKSAFQRAKRRIGFYSRCVKEPVSYTHLDVYKRQYIVLKINTDRVMTIARNALYFEDYVLSIQYFNQVINAKPYLLSLIHI